MIKPQFKRFILRKKGGKMYKRITGILIAMVVAYSVNVTADTGEIISIEELGNEGVLTEESVSDCGIVDKNIFIGEVGKSFNADNVSGNEYNEKADEVLEESGNENVPSETISPILESAREPAEENSISENESIIDEREELNEQVNTNEQESEDIDLESVSTNELIKEGATEDKQGLNEKTILKVEMPAKVQAYFDPQNLSGKGEVYSEKYKVVNYGNRDIVIKIKKINTSYGSDPISYEFSQEPVQNNSSEKKEVNINMIWDNAKETQQRILNIAEGRIEEYVIYLKAAKYDKNGNFIKLDKDSVGMFYFTGTVNSNPDIEWQDGEIALNLSYQIENVEKNMVNEFAESL